MRVFFDTVVAQENVRHFLHDANFFHPNLDQNVKLISWLLVFFQELGCWHSTSIKCGIWTGPNQTRYDPCICKQICSLGVSSYNVWSRSTSLSQLTSLFKVASTSRCTNHQTTTKLSKIGEKITMLAPAQTCINVPQVSSLGEILHIMKIRVFK